MQEEELLSSSSSAVSLHRLLRVGLAISLPPWKVVARCPGQRGAYSCVNANGGRCCGGGGGSAWSWWPIPALVSQLLSHMGEPDIPASGG